MQSSTLGDAAVTNAVAATTATIHFRRNCAGKNVAEGRAGVLKTAVGSANDGLFTTALDPAAWGQAAPPRSNVNSGEDTFGRLELLDANDRPALFTASLP